MSVSPAASAYPAAPPELGPERPLAWPRRIVRRISNGLLAVLAEQRSFPKISAELFFRSGNAVTALHSPGLAGMTASVVRTGTESRSNRQIEEGLRRMGADLSTSAGADSSAISIAGLAESSRGMLELVADLAQKATFPAAELERERRQRLEELRIERTTPSFLGNERLRRALFGEHPYAIVAPTETQLEAYRREELQRFYREHYVPSEALLIVVGDFASGKIMDGIEQVFGAWKGAPSALPATPEPPKARGRRVHLVHLPEKVQAEIFVGNLAITRHSPAWPPLALANAIFGGAFNSRLVMNIREQKGYTYSPRSSVNALREHGYFSVHAAVRNEVVAATLTEIFYEMDRMRSLPVGKEELADAQNYLSGVFSLGVATQDGLLGQLSTVYLDRLPEDYLETYREKIRRLAAEDVLAAARKYFDSANAPIVLVGDRGQIGEQAALFGEVETFDAQGNLLS